jgi:hypothetical protein
VRVVSIIDGFSAVLVVGVVVAGIDASVVSGYSRSDWCGLLCSLLLLLIALVRLIRLVRREVSTD